MLTREELLPARMAEALIESGVDLDCTDHVARVLIEHGFSVPEICEHTVEAVAEARLSQAIGRQLQKTAA